MDTVEYKTKLYRHDICTTNYQLTQNTIEEQEEYILNNFPLLKLDSFKLTKEVDDDLEDFIYNFLNVYNSHHATITADDETRAISSIGRHRSILDIYLISKYYFPEISLKDVMICVIKLYDEDLIVTQICSTVNRRVFDSKEKFPDWTNYNMDDEDEFNKDFNDYRKLI